VNTTHQLDAGWLLVQVRVLGLRPASIGGETMLLKAKHASLCTCSCALLMLIRRTPLAHAWPCCKVAEEAEWSIGTRGFLNSAKHTCIVRKPKHFLYSSRLSTMKVKATYVPRMPRDAMLTKLRKKDFLRTERPALKMIGGRKKLQNKRAFQSAACNSCCLCILQSRNTAIWHQIGMNIREEVARVECEHGVQGLLPQELMRCKKC